MALYISPARRRRTTVLVGVAALVIGLVAGLILGRATSSGVDDAVTESRAEARRFASSLQVLPLEYEKAASDPAASKDLVDRALAGEDQLIELAPWLPDATIAELRADLDVVRAAPSTALTPEEFTAAVEAAVTDVESVFGLTASA